MATSRTRTKLPKVGPRSAGILMTPQEFHALTDCDRRYRYELIRGVLVVTPPPSTEERGPNDHFAVMLDSYKTTHPQGAALDDTLPEQTVTTRECHRRADRVIWAGLGRQPDPETDVPTIVIEFVSRGKRDWQRDYIEKRREYAEIGVAEYWLFDRFRRILTVHRNTPAGIVEQVVSESETYRTDLLPGFELPLARLLAVADRWKKKPRK